MSNKFLSCVNSKIGLISSIIYVQKEKYPQSWLEYFNASLGVEYRFRACFESNNNFTESFKKFGDGPPPSERYIQEKELFHFFINGYSAFDCFAYALYMVAFILKPDFFPINESCLRRIYFKNIGSKNSKNKEYIFENVFPKEKITDELNLIKNSKEYKDWETIRNALIHRISPGRTFHISKQRGITTWIINNKTFDIDESLTSSRFFWLKNSLINLLDTMLDFANKIQSIKIN